MRVALIITGHRRERPGPFKGVHGEGVTAAIGLAADDSVDVAAAPIPGDASPARTGSAGPIKTPVHEFVYLVTTAQFGVHAGGGHHAVGQNGLIQHVVAGVLHELQTPVRGLQEIRIGLTKLSPGHVFKPSDTRRPFWFNPSIGEGPSGAKIKTVPVKIGRGVGRGSHHLTRVIPVGRGGIEHAVHTLVAALVTEWNAQAGGGRIAIHQAREENVREELIPKIHAGRGGVNGTVKHDIQIGVKILAHHADPVGALLIALVDADDGGPQNRRHGVNGFGLRVIGHADVAGEGKPRQGKILVGDVGLDEWQVKTGQSIIKHQ